MTKNIESIELWEDNPDKTRTSKIVRINFKFPCTWTTLTIEELKEIIRLWIQTEEERYPLSDGFDGRWMLFKEIRSVFQEKEVKSREETLRDRHLREMNEGYK